MKKQILFIILFIICIGSLSSENQVYDKNDLVNSHFEALDLILGKYVFIQSEAYLNYDEFNLYKKEVEIPTNGEYTEKFITFTGDKMLVAERKYSNGEFQKSVEESFDIGYTVFNGRAYLRTSKDDGVYVVDLSFTEEYPNFLFLEYVNGGFNEMTKIAMRCDWLQRIE